MAHKLKRGDGGRRFSLVAVIFYICIALLAEFYVLGVFHFHDTVTSLQNEDGAGCRQTIQALSVKKVADAESSSLSSQKQLQAIDTNAQDGCVKAVHKMQELLYSYRRDPLTHAAPMYHYALHHLSGFGRPLEQSVRLCHLALALDRPCVVDWDPRDEFYTWRGFVNINSYDWEASRTVNRTNIYDAMNRNPNGNGHHIFDSYMDYDNVLPLMKSENWETAKLEWGAQNQSVRHKMLLSPNYGLSWFPHVKAPPQATFDCPREQALTAIQNAMYQPTILTQNLHEQRRQKVMMNDTHYGGIHLRTKIADFRKLHLTHDQYLEMVQSCIQEETTINKWWVVSDNVELADFITEKIPNVYTTYTEEFVSMNKHSASARGMFDHEGMMNSVLDWMVLWGSGVSLITGGAFGGTGAQGKGKYSRGKCGQRRLKARLTLYK